ncbi:MAG: hypothetical protein GQF41_3373 [Candidatus Rifleibacterium amylolyticum]|nr:MAG: hypothetical protein GQF41_3373 [Candidatus Rifleibacterium amylolyticum]
MILKWVIISSNSEDLRESVALSQASRINFIASSIVILKS